MRGKQAPKRQIAPDPKYNSVVLARFINKVMKQGKKVTAQKIVYDALEQIADKTKQDPVEVMGKALRNVGPSVEVRSRRVGGANYQIPFPVKGDRQETLAMRWIIKAAKSQKGKPMREKIAQELMAASKSEGVAMKKKTDVLRMAEANKAFAHFARFG